MDVSYEDQVGCWIAWGDETLILGFGQTEAEAVDDYRDNCRECLNRLVELGPDRVAKHLWATVPALQQALDLTS